MARNETGSNYFELLGHFRRVRAYMQHFYIYGFYTRDEFKCGSARGYDNERRRVEGWLGDYMGFHTTKAGKSAFISFDSRSVPRNPLYRALKSKSFTDLDITMYFLVMDVLMDGQERGVQEILKGCGQRLDRACASIVYDEKTLRDKLNEYEALGLLSSRRQGRQKIYRMREREEVEQLAPALAFFSETATCGVVGSFLEDRLEQPCDCFRMKHHYIVQTFDSDLIAALLEAMRKKTEVTLVHMGKDGKKESQQTVVPLYILRSAQDGRTYIAAWGREQKGFLSCRLDRISEVKPGQAADDLDELRALYDQTRPNRWGASLNGKKPLHIEFTIRVDPREEYVRRRMYRERRCGQVEELDGGGRMRFSAELYDPSEILPWIRTFTGRITEFSCESEFVTNRFYDDLAQLAMMYEDEPEGEAEG